MLKRNFKILLVLLVAVFLVGCSTKDGKLVAGNSTNCNSGDFEMNLYSDKKEYNVNDKINIWGTIKYVGEQSSITIYSGEPFMVFSITNGKNFNSMGTALTILKTTTLVKDKLYHYDYVKSGGFDADAPDADFWEKFYKEKDLYLPADEYTIILKGDFSLSPGQEQLSGLACGLKIKVTK